MCTLGHCRKVAGDQRPNTVHWWAALLFKPRALQVSLIILDPSGHTEMVPQLCELLDGENTQWWKFHNGPVEVGLAAAGYSALSLVFEDDDGGQGHGLWTAIDMTQVCSCG